MVYRRNKLMKISRVVQISTEKWESTMGLEQIAIEQN